MVVGVAGWKVMGHGLTLFTGEILGQACMGIVDKIGSEVKTLTKGDVSSPGTFASCSVAKRLIPFPVPS